MTEEVSACEQLWSLRERMHAARHNEMAELLHDNFEAHDKEHGARARQLGLHLDAVDTESLRDWLRWWDMTETARQA